MRTDPNYESLTTSLRKTVDPFGFLTSSLEVQQAWLRHPGELFKEYSRLGSDLTALNIWQRLLGYTQHPDLVPPHTYDERFQDQAWIANPYLDTIKEVYLLYVHWLVDAIYHTPAIPDKTKNKSAFWVREILNTIAPTNFFWTNPVAVTRAFQSNGESLVKGWENFITDLSKGGISMVDESKFQVGRNLATTPGAVIFRNELIEIIQYQAVTQEVHAIPIVIMAPWINKYYVLDLSRKNSLIDFLVRQGFTVFVSSWKNPGPEQREVAFEDYMVKGILEPLEAVKAICHTDRIHLTGYCIGGTLVAAFLAWLKAGKNKNDLPVAHATLITSLVDFAEVGDLGIFIDEHSIEYLEKSMDQNGYLDGGSMAMTFRSLRSNSLIWYYWVHNYLYGEAIPEWDVLFWNTDSTRLPLKMHSYYLREFYLHNKLTRKNAVTLAGRKIDLSRITEPLYIVGTEQDHITPWKSAFKTSQLVRGPVRFALATSGHILGVLSPPVDPPKRRYWVSDVTGSMTADEWRETTEKIPGSWWQDWSNWLSPKCGKKVRPPALGNKQYPRLAAAPGTYVLEQ
ncbi:MAG: alpha/beta hydrolase [Gammaproteobacteria bacterium]|nr:alpha/beta hydrolase [Gammaproteobacteria bacterium]